MKKKDIEDVEVLIKDLDETDINSLLRKTVEVGDVRRKVEELEEMLKTKVKVFLKEKGWNRYSDKDTNVSVTLLVQKRQNIDKKQLKLMLSDAQFAQVINTVTFERLSIITPEARERLKKYVKPKKI